MRISNEFIKSAEASGWRKMYTTIVTELAKTDDRVIYACADLGRACGCAAFECAFPDRFVNVGIAEQNGISVSAGLASFGNIVFFSTFAPFATMRVLEQIRLNCAYTHLPVIITGTDTGISLTPLGNTHYGLEDMGVVRAIPGMTVVSPADGLQMARLMEKMLTYNAPVYMRIADSRAILPVYAEDRDFEIGKAVSLKDGKDVTIAACGAMVAVALDAAKLLAKEGIDAAVLDIHTIKPLDEAAVKQAIKKTGLIVSLEEHVVTSGLGSAIAEVIAAEGAGKLLKIGLPDAFLPTIASYNEKMEELGLTASPVAQKIKAFLQDSKTFTLDRMAKQQDGGQGRPLNLFQPFPAECCFCYILLYVNI